LNNITLACIDSVQPDKAKKAMDRCKEYFEFGGEVFIDQGIHSRQDYSRFILQELHKHIHTDFVLIVQWDGYIINPDAWKPEFLDYDYIGAVWPWHPEGLRIGNGGFSLRSRVLCQLTASPQFVYKDINEDDMICHLNRDFLVSNGIKFAPEEIARYFSFERELSNIKTFGFHGDFNFERLGLY
jgi:hypothetical protein